MEHENRSERVTGYLPFKWMAIGILFLAAGVQGATVADFEDLTLEPQQFVAAQGSSEPFFSRGVEFSRDWNSEFNCCPTGWAYSNVTDQTTPGFTNAYAAVARSTAGGGFESENFGVVSNLTRGEAEVRFTQAGVVQGMYVTNVTYTYLAVRDGNDGAGFVKGPFAAGDWLRLEVIGLNGDGNETGRVPVYLADYRNGSTLMDEWTWIDLHALGSQVAQLEFEMSSTDIGDFGMNTPALFAVDNLTFEPTSIEGDFNRDGRLDIHDLRLLTEGIRSEVHEALYDVTGDQRVTSDDLTEWVRDLRQTWLGDANLDGRFDSTDLVQVFQAGRYDQMLASDWTEGDWNGDLRFDSGDLVAAFQDGGFERGAKSAVVASIPEPATGLAVSLIALIALGRRRPCGLN